MNSIHDATKLNSTANGKRNFSVTFATSQNGEMQSQGSVKRKTQVFIEFFAIFRIL